MSNKTNNQSESNFKFFLNLLDENAAGIAYLFFLTLLAISILIGITIDLEYKHKEKMIELQILKEKKTILILKQKEFKPLKKKKDYFRNN